MKASKIILLSLILVSVLIIGAIPVTLRYKFKNKLYTQLNPDEAYTYDRHSFGMSNTLIISDLDNCTIIPSDTFQIEVERMSNDMVKFIEKGDTFMIGSIDKNKNATQRVRLFVPATGKVICRNSDILLRGSIKKEGIPSFSFDLVKSELSTGAISDEWRVYQFLDVLKINGLDSAKVNLAGSVRIRSLVLSNVSFVKTENHVNIDNMQVVYNGKDSVKSKSIAGSLSIQAF